MIDEQQTQTQSEQGIPQQSVPSAQYSAAVRTPRQKWLRISLLTAKYASIPVLSFIMLMTGLWIGYVKLGDQPSGEIWEWSTWRHLFDLIFADE